MAAKRIDIREFRAQGFLQEANRLFFHPLGLALEVVIEEDGTERLGAIWDYRDDPEGVYFAEKLDTQKADDVRQERNKHRDARQAFFRQDGRSEASIQPLDWAPTE